MAVLSAQTGARTCRMLFIPFYSPNLTFVLCLMIPTMFLFMFYVPAVSLSTVHNRAELHLFSEPQMVGVV